MTLTRCKTAVSITAINSLLVLLALLISSATLASPMPPLTDLSQDRKQAGQRFLLVLVSQPGCSYCALIEDEVLQPMQISGNYDSQLLFRKLTINDGRQLTDFDGKQLSADRLAYRYNSSLTPTLLFLDPVSGEQLAEKMVGVSTIEMYGFYVDKAVNQAYNNLLSRQQPQTRGLALPASQISLQ